MWKLLFTTLFSATISTGLAETFGYPTIQGSLQPDSDSAITVHIDTTLQIPAGTITQVRVYTWIEFVQAYIQVWRPVSGNQYTLVHTEGLMAFDPGVQTLFVNWRVQAGDVLGIQKEAREGPVAWTEDGADVPTVRFYTSSRAPFISNVGSSLEFDGVTQRRYSIEFDMTVDPVAATTSRTTSATTSSTTSLTTSSTTSLTTSSTTSSTTLSTTSSTTSLTTSSTTSPTTSSTSSSTSSTASSTTSSTTPSTTSLTTSSTTASTTSSTTASTTSSTTASTTSLTTSSTTASATASTMPVQPPNDSVMLGRVCSSSTQCSIIPGLMCYDNVCSCGWGTKPSVNNTLPCLPRGLGEFCRAPKDCNIQNTECRSATQLTPTRCLCVNTHELCADNTTCCAKPVGPTSPTACQPGYFGSECKWNVYEALVIIVILSGILALIIGPIIMFVRTRKMKEDVPHDYDFGQRRHARTTSLSPSRFGSKGVRRNYRVSNVDEEKSSSSSEAEV